MISLLASHSLGWVALLRGAHRAVFSRERALCRRSRVLFICATSTAEPNPQGHAETFDPIQAPL